MSPSGETADKRHSSVRETSGQGTFQATSVPEPATLTLTAIGAFGLLFYRWRRPERAVAPRAVCGVVFPGVAKGGKSPRGYL